MSNLELNGLKGTMWSAAQFFFLVDCVYPRQIQKLANKWSVGGAEPVTVNCPPHLTIPG